MCTRLIAAVAEEGSDDQSYVQPPSVRLIMAVAEDSDDEKPEGWRLYTRLILEASHLQRGLAQLQRGRRKREMTREVPSHHPMTREVPSHHHTR